jgi:hypothetical protein
MSLSIRFPCSVWVQYLVTIFSTIPCTNVREKHLSRTCSYTTSLHMLLLFRTNGFFFFFLFFSEFVMLKKLSGTTYILSLYIFTFIFRALNDIEISKCKIYSFNESNNFKLHLHENDDWNFIIESKLRANFIQYAVAVITSTFAFGRRVQILSVFSYFLMLAHILLYMLSTSHIV